MGCTNTYPGAAAYARWSTHSQLLMFIEQGNLYNSINFNIPPETPGMAGDIAFMPAYQNTNRENSSACLTQVSCLPLPFRRQLEPARHLAGREQLPGQPCSRGPAT